ncbi:MAG: chemotaxis protein CheW [Treponema sp.]|nr:chemotaxis protein CheW [Treponema sp.]
MEAINLENTEMTTAEKLLAETDAKKEAASFIDFKMVSFSLAGKDYAIDIMHVKEIAKAGRFTYVPNTLPFVLGVYNLRGEIIPILDLRLFFNIEVEERDDDKLENLLILNVDDQIFGLVVDKIDKVVGVQKSTIQPPHPLFGDINIKYISGVVECNNRLYVLLDVERIFTAKEKLESQDKESSEFAAFAQKATMPIPAQTKAPSVGAPAANAAAPVEKKAAPVVEQTADIKFIADSLRNDKGFYLSPVNEGWVQRRLTEWTKEPGNKSQLQNADETEKFLSTFWSSYTGSWWSKEYADNLYKLLPENSAKQIVVWNPGCGTGVESYCLACVLKKRYPDAKIRIYAQDIDLLNVSNASLLAVPAQITSSWIEPYLSKKANGDYTFSQEIKDSLMFEYHDCKNTNVLPMIDVIFARDVLSVIDQKSQETIIEEFIEKMKGNGVAIIGENESMPASYRFSEKSVDSLVGYSKE